MIGKLRHHKIETGIELSTPYLKNNSSNYLESPTFHTLDIKNNLKKKVDEYQYINESHVTLNDRVKENDRIPLQESNKQNFCYSPLEKSKN